MMKGDVKDKLITLGVFLTILLFIYLFSQKNTEGGNFFEFDGTEIKIPMKDKIIKYQFSDELRKNTVKGVGDVFFLGIKNSESFTDARLACPFSMGHKNVFCMEGYYLALVLKKIDSQEVVTEKFMIKTLEESGDLGAEALLAFGIVSSMLNLDLTKFLSEVSKNTLPPYTTKYVVDGWGFYQANYKNGLNIERECHKNFSDKLSIYCLWGAGRAYFFSAENQLKSSNIFFKEGYQFARSFAGLTIKSSSHKETSVGYRSGKLLKDYYNGEFKQESKIASTFLKCLINNHIIDCMDNLVIAK